MSRVQAVLVDIRLDDGIGLNIYSVPTAIRFDTQGKV